MHRARLWKKRAVFNRIQQVSFFCTENNSGKGKPVQNFWGDLQFLEFMLAVMSFTIWENSLSVEMDFSTF